MAVSMLLLAVCAALAAPAQPGPSPLRVAVAGSAPFVQIDGTRVEGLSVDVWRAAATELKLDYVFVPMSGVGRALEAVASGRADVAVGPISITAERAQHVGFSQPYFRSTLAILAPVTASSMLDQMVPFFRRILTAGLSVLAFVLLLVGTLVWLAERKKNPQFPQNPVPGIGNGVWIALVTMSTVGYGDRYPITLPGRVVMGAWMLISMVTASSLTAGLATAFTLAQMPQPGITSAEQLHGKTVAVVSGTTGATFADQRGARLLSVPSLQNAILMVSKGRAKALVFDRPQLSHHLRLAPDETLRISDGSYEPQAYGFALPLGSPLRAGVDVALLRLRESNRLDEIGRVWLGEEL